MASIVATNRSFHIFNKEENKHVKLVHLPPMSDYIPGGMMAKKHNEFIKWYNANYNTPFSLEEALPDYCNNDTDILMKAVLKMRRLPIKITNGYDVLITACTIAGIAIQIFRRLFLIKELLPIVPEFGYEKIDNASDKAIKYLVKLKYLFVAINFCLGMDCKSARNSYKSCG